MFADRPFLRGLLGGAAGMFAVAAVLAVLYQGWIVYTDHQVLAQIVTYINNAAKQSAAP